MPRGYLVRYGRMGHIGLFAADPDAEYDRGRAVIIRTCRGIEAGDVLLVVDHPADTGAADHRAQILRAAMPEELSRMRDFPSVPERLQAIQDVLDGFPDPPLLLDLEPLLDADGVVLQILADPDRDLSALRDRLSDRLGLVAVFEAVPPPIPVEEADLGDCGSGACGSGGCGSSPGCASCGVRSLMASR